jgi:hypothetical protein
MTSLPLGDTLAATTHVSAVRLSRRKKKKESIFLFSNRKEKNHEWSEH